VKVAVLRERREAEHRVAVTPNSVKKLLGLGLEVAIEAGAGMSVHLTDATYEQVGARVMADADAALEGAELVLVVQQPKAAELARIASGAVLIGLLDPMANKADMAETAKVGITAFSLEFLPRISRAQSMDALSSQSSLAGYRAVIDGAAKFGRAFPLMMTAAGTIAPAKVFVMGAGVAGLQAIATAKRLGAVVSATDVRAAASEQVESLGASFIAPPVMEDAETVGGYAKELGNEMRRRQAKITSETLTRMDVVICTALIPGRPAPVLIDEDMVRTMKAGSVIVDLAVEQGGNCTLSKPGEVVEAHGVHVLGHRNVPSRIAVDASSQYAQNLLNFLTPLLKDGTFAIDWEDEIVQGALITRGGKVVHPRLAG